MTVQTNLVKLKKLITALRTGGEQMPIQMAHVYVAIMAHPGITMAQLAKEVGISQASCSRSVAALGDWHRLGKPGHGLVETAPDPREGRRMIMFLSPKGRELARQLLTTIDPDQVVEDLHFPSAKEYLTGTYERSLRELRTKRK